MHHKFYQSISASWTWKLKRPSKPVVDVFFWTNRYAESVASLYCHWDSLHKIKSRQFFTGSFLYFFCQSAWLAWLLEDHTVLHKRHMSRYQRALVPKYWQDTDRNALLNDNDNLTFHQNIIERKASFEHKLLEYFHFASFCNNFALLPSFSCRTGKLYHLMVTRIYFFVIS